MAAVVDIGGWCGYGFSRSRDQGSPAEMNCRAAGRTVAGRCGGGVAKPGLVQDGDAADDRTGWPQCSGAATSSAVTVVPGEGVGLRTRAPGGSAVGSSSRSSRTGDRADCRTERRIARPPAVRSTSCSTALPALPARASGSRGKNGGVERHQDRPDGTTWVRVPQDIDRQVVSGHAFAIPVPPPAYRAAVRTQWAGAALRPADGVAVPSGPWCYGTRAPLHVPTARRRRPAPPAPRAGPARRRYRAGRWGGAVGWPGPGVRSGRGRGRLEG